MLIAFILGIIEGLTEFLPISSTGHLILFGNLLGFTGEKAATFEIFIQLGAILAVIISYRKRFYSLLSPRQEATSGTDGIILLGLTSLPALIVGFILHDFIKSSLFNPATVAISLFLGGVALIAVERWHKSENGAGLDKLSSTQALKIGLFQILALWPGFSRSGATIVGARLIGLNRKAAVEYSFLAAVPIMIISVSYDLLSNLSSLSKNDIPVFVIGLVTAFLTALLAINVFVRFVEKFTLAPFGWYRIGVSAVLVALLVLT